MSVPEHPDSSTKMPTGFPASEPREPSFVNNFLDWKLNERLGEALTWVSNLSTQEVKTINTDSLTAAVQRFAIPVPIVAGQPMRDATMVELEDLALERKTGATGHIFLLPVAGDIEWFQEIDMQTVMTDSHPLAFIDESRSWIFIKLTIEANDPEGTLKRKLDERLELIREYTTYVNERILKFNKEVIDKMIKGFTARKEAIQRGESEAASLGLGTTYNPQHAETAIKIAQIMENLSARFVTRPVTATGETSRRDGKNMSDLHENAVKIARYLYTNNFVGSRSVTADTLRGETGLSQEEFDTADQYLLGNKICGGTGGGDAGMRWLTATGVDFVRLNDRENRSPVLNAQDKPRLDVFLSHSSQDTAIARAIVSLFRAALNIPSDRIRCTSLDGHRLPIGAEIDERLRTELRESKVFLGLITEASIKSTYVVFELGARWGAGLPLLPVLVSSKDKALLRGPLGAFNALACDSRPQVLQLLDDVASKLNITPERAASYQDHVDAVLSAADGMIKNPNV